MIDFARVVVKAGNGGNGCGSFRKLKGKRYGKADGGNGGNGGNVYLEASADLNTLERFRYVKDYQAGSGSGGLSRLRRGAGGEDLVLKVPVGTEIQLSVFGFQLSEKSYSVGQSVGNTPGVSQGVTKHTPGVSEGTDNRNTEFFDLTGPGQRVLVARGGLGGRGNAHLRDEFGRRPKVGERGQEGEVCNLTLELKLIADVGLIGLPNAGKSTLLAKLTSAKPKIAAYPFTTLEPNLGVLEVRVESQSGKSKKEDRLYNPDFDFRLVLADIPGLIEGASEGRGLGDLFLRHIERTGLLVHLIDVSKVSEVSGVWGDYQTVRKELKNYSKELVKKKEIVVLTKIDLVDQKIVEEALDFFKKKRKRVLAISATTGDGLDDLRRVITKAN